MANRLLPELQGVNALMSGSNSADFSDPIKARNALHAARAAAPKPVVPSSVKVEEIQLSHGLRTLVFKPSSAQRPITRALLWFTDGGERIAPVKRMMELRAACRRHVWLARGQHRLAMVRAAQRDTRGTLSPRSQLTERLGVVCVAPAYRLAPEHPHPAQIDDAQASFAWLTSPDAPKALGIKQLDAIALGGSSFGGFLASKLAQLTVDATMRPSAVILDAPVTAPSTETTRVKSKEAETCVCNRFPRVLPDLAVRLHIWTWTNGQQSQKVVGVPSDFYPLAADDATLARLPPHFIGLAELDSLTPDALLYAQRLLCQGVPTGLHLESQTFHCFASVMPHLDVSKAYNALFASFLERTLVSPARKVVVLTGA
jgi:acetyl esterase/lipase